MNNSTKKAKSNTNVVCFGASAGGLEAIEGFFKSCPDNLGVSYIVIQHLSSSYKSMMEDLMNRYTTMPIKMIKTGLTLEPDTVYLIEAGTTITIRDNIFITEQKHDGGLTLPIDIFLRSLANCDFNKIIAIILSGTGSDGSRGALAINAKGGFVIAQDPTEAGFDGMPNSVLGTGIVDQVLPVREMPALIARYITVGIEQPPKEKILKEDSSDVSASAQLKRIFQKLEREFGINFNLYKEATVERRVERRMQVKHIRDYLTYANFLESDPIEPIALRNELLIPVTNFFRDESAFVVLKDNVIDKMVLGRKDADPIRIWVSGCSTGEEAYTIAMLITDSMRKQKKIFPFKIFATDANPEVISTASQGIYPDGIQNEVPAQYLKDYFIKEANQYHIRSDIRDKVVFAVHNLLVDAPFTKMDLVSCRNTLIYFKNEAQREAISRLQYAVNEGGYLFLGKSESMIINEENFAQLDRKNKIFQCVKASKGLINSINFAVSAKNIPPAVISKIKLPNSNQAQLKAEKIINQTFMPLSLLVNSQFEIIHIYGEDTNILKIKSGAMNNHVSSLLPDKLAPVALALIYRLNKEQTEVSSDVVDIAKSGEASRYVKLTGWVIIQDDIPAHYVISIIDITFQLSTTGKSIVDVDQVNTDRIKQLEIELNATRESLQSTIEELETTNEELQSTNEELMASNEELQSSNEELQSVNEELNTVNAEYHEKMTELNRINADLDVMSSSTGFASIFVDSDLQLTRFTPDAQELFRIRKQDIGRPLDEIVHTLLYDNLYSDIAQTIGTGKSQEREVISNNGKSYITKIMSYEVPSQRRSGAVVSLMEINNLATFQTIIDSVSHHIAVLDKKGDIALVNRAWQHLPQDTQADENKLLKLGRNFLVNCGNKALCEGIKEVLNGRQEEVHLKYQYRVAGSSHWYVTSVNAIEHPKFKAVITMCDVTEWES